MRISFFLIMIFIFMSQALSTGITTDDKRTIVYDPNFTPNHTKDTSGLFVGINNTGGREETYRAAVTYDFSDILGWHVVTNGYIDLEVDDPDDDFKLFLTTVGNQHPPSRTDPQLYDDIEDNELNSGLLIQTGYNNLLYLNTAMKDHFDTFVECEAEYAPLGFKSGEGTSEDFSFVELTQDLDLTCSAVMSTEGTLSDDERWGGTSHGLTDDVEVPNGVELKLWDGIEFDLNGHSVVVRAVQAQ
jgi:hypothetical protein